MVNDWLSDFITRIRNGYRAGRMQIWTSSSREVVGVAQVLVKRGYLAGVEKEDKGLKVSLKYAGKKPAVMGIRRGSKPGARRYSGKGEYPRVWGGLGVNIVSTPGGIMDHKQAQKLNHGGE